MMSPWSSFANIEDRERLDKDQWYTNSDEPLWMFEQYDLPPPFSEGPRGWRSWVPRFLAEASSYGRMDYSVLSVTVMTLGLIMVVEVLKHRLDHAALGRPYFTAVLENIYGELSTLGMVEFFVFLLQEYHTTMDKGKKGVFSDVHFALFYTAVLNAFQSMILAFFTMRVSSRMWVKTEALELNHYVEVREEFDRVQAELNKLGVDYEKHTDDPDNNENGDSEGGDNNNTTKERGSLKYNHTEYVFEASWQGLKLLWRRVVNLIRRPQLMRRYNDLLIQVRFHELRVHFLRSYDLPPKLKISDYLIRCEQTVLIKLVHVSIVAWLLLTASANLLYFLLGILGYYKESAKLVGVAMSYIYFASIGIFVVMAFSVQNKMKSIFREIMHRPNLWATVDDKDEHNMLAKEQMSLFWGGSPKIVISFIQFMQFGYAVALAIIIIFWKIIDGGDVAMGWLLAGIGVCYPIFVMVAAHVIPRYTLCTSLAQLVDKQRLNETVANFHLEEAKRRRQAEMYVNTKKYVHAVPAVGLHGTAETDLHHQLSGSSSISSTEEIGVEVTIADLVGMKTEELRDKSEEMSIGGGGSRSKMMAPRRGRRSRQKAVSDGVAMMASLREMTNEDEHEEMEIGGKGHSATEPFVRQSSQNSFNQRDRSGPSNFRVHQTDDFGIGTSAAPRRGRIGRQKSKSDGVAFMASLKEDDLPSPLFPQRDTSEQSERIADLVNIDTAKLRENLSKEELKKLEENEFLKRDRKNRRVKVMSDPKKIEEMRSKDDFALTQEESIARRRNRRRKTVSDGVQLMAALVPSGFAPLGKVLSKSDESSPKSGEDGQNEDGDGKSDQSQADADESDNFSDVDDIPMVDTARLSTFPRSHSQMERSTIETFRDRCTDYFVSKRFPVLSNVFGTMFAFFMIGSRVERFLHTEHIVSGDFISFDFNQVVTFWILSGYFFAFLTMDCLVYFSVDRFVINQKHRVVWLASVMDAFLVSGCLVVLYVAESQRCCDPSSTAERRLAGTSSASEYGSKGSDNLNYDSKGGYYGDPAPCDCPAFGSRLYGGLGSIEPWDSLVALRVFRFYIAKRFVERMDRKRGIFPTKEETKNDVANEEHLDPFDVYEPSNLSKANDRSIHQQGGHPDHGGGHGDHGPLRGTAAELWEKAIAQSPHIAEKYGWFSSEILQLMLGLPLKPPSDELDEKEKTSNQALPPSREVSFVFSDGSPDRSPGRANRGASFRLNDKYKGLSLSAQEMIMRGELGRKVHSVIDLSGVHPIPEDDEPERKSSYMFQISDELSVQPFFDLNLQLPFDAPNEQIVRNMRRCDRKLLPILNKWTAVDVVVTRFEIVYFDASDCLDGPEVEVARQALKATKGGKGLLVKDVAVGRKVVGHLLLSEITSIAIERYMPSGEPHDDEDGLVPEALATEFWKEETVHFSRNRAWSKVKQDALAIHTSHGNTLYLRFYSDLEAAESHPERMGANEEEEGKLYRNNAFQWVQTIGRLCGPRQLQQNLPHFGSDTDDELRDYLVVHHEHEQKKHATFLAIHGANIRGHETVAETSKRNQHRLFGRASIAPSRPVQKEIDASEKGVNMQASPEPSRLSLLKRSRSLGDSEELVDEMSEREAAEAAPSLPTPPVAGPRYGRSISLGDDRDRHSPRRISSRSTSHSTSDSAIPMPPVAEHGDCGKEDYSESKKEEDDSPV